MKIIDAFRTAHRHPVNLALHVLSPVPGLAALAVTGLEPLPLVAGAVAALVMILTGHAIEGKPPALLLRHRVRRAAISPRP